jgi:hypothetical protein
MQPSRRAVYAHNAPQRSNRARLIGLLYQTITTGYLILAGARANFL